jgi:hypothetical protein
MELARYKLNFGVYSRLRGTKGHSKTRGLYFFLNNTLKIILQDTKIDAMGIEIFLIMKNTFYALCIWLLLVRINNSLKTISVRKFNNC